ncbi:MAG: transposase family protein, partial [Elusimicrobia bacterium]|nr:transposase family protein [Elusimicrobiota bacterium]
QYPWSVRLKAVLPLWMPWIEKRWVLDRHEEKLLLAMSPATNDRRLASYKRERSRKIYGKTKPGRWLRQTIPIQTESWEVPEPGWLEIDTVSHSGASAEGLFAYTVNATDLFSGWVECRAILGKGSAEVVAALQEMRQAAPFELKGLDSDNGEEFINWHLNSYCRDKGIQRFRSRPYKKDDQAHIEQKNWTHVRKLVGWDRYDTQMSVDALNDLYRNEWRLFCNLYLPSVKLARKIRVGSRIKRVYEEAKTPLDRLLGLGKGNLVKLEALRRLREKTDPFELSAIIDKKLARIWSLASKASLRLVEKPHVRKRPYWEPRSGDYQLSPALFLPYRNIQMSRIRSQWAKGRMLGTN